VVFVVILLVEKHVAEVTHISRLELSASRAVVPRMDFQKMLVQIIVFTVRPRAEVTIVHPWQFSAVSADNVRMCKSVLV
jgi:hypothetical protein